MGIIILCLTVLLSLVIWKLACAKKREDQWAKIVQRLDRRLERYDKTRFNHLSQKRDKSGKFIKNITAWIICIFIVTSCQPSYPTSISDTIWSDEDSGVNVSMEFKSDGMCILKYMLIDSWLQPEFSFKYAYKVYFPNIELIAIDHDFHEFKCIIYDNRLSVINPTTGKEEFILYQLDWRGK